MPERLQAGDDYSYIAWTLRGGSVFSRVLVLAALIVAAVLAVLILLTSATVTMLTALGVVAVALALYFGSLLVP